MINYSLALRGNPSDPDMPKRAYALAQYTDIMNITEFSRHISSHGCVYSRADIQGVLTLAVDCIRELLLNGQRIQLGDLGTFSVSLKSKGAKSVEDFNAAVNIRGVNPKFTPGDALKNMMREASFNHVLTRENAAKALKAEAESTL